MLLNTPIISFTKNVTIYKVIQKQLYTLQDEHASPKNDGFWVRNLLFQGAIFRFFPKHLATLSANKIANPSSNPLRSNPVLGEGRIRDVASKVLLPGPFKPECLNHTHDKLYFKMLWSQVQQGESFFCNTFFIGKNGILSETLGVCEIHLTGDLCHHKWSLIKNKKLYFISLYWLVRRDSDDSCAAATTVEVSPVRPARYRKKKNILSIGMAHDLCLSFVAGSYPSPRFPCSGGWKQLKIFSKAWWISWWWILMNPIKDLENP